MVITRLRGLDVGSGPRPGAWPLDRGHHSLRGRKACSCRAP